MEIVAEPLQFAEGDGRNPRNWPKPYRWMLTVLISLYTFVAPMSSSMVAPGLKDISIDLSIQEDLVTQLVLSIFLLAYGCGPMILGPLSEHFGRRPILQLGNMLYLAFNTACGASKTTAQLIVFRAFSGFGGSAPLAIGAGSIADLFIPEDRGTALALYNMAPLLGPSVGPILGSIVTQYLSWRWIFWVTSIFDALLLLVGSLILRETYAPKLLQKIYAKDTNNYHLENTGPSSENALQTAPFDGHTWKKVLVSIRGAFARPIRMIATQPIIQIQASFIACLYGTMYLTLSTFPKLWVGKYHESTAIGGLNYLSLGLGYLIGSQVCIFFIDRIYKRLKQKNNGNGKPEMKIPLLLPGVCLVPIGLILYGWSAQNKLFWIVPDLGALLFSMGAMISMQCSTNYNIDTYGKYTASATGAVTILRGFAGFGFPLFAPYLFNTLGLGWGNSLLAFVAVAIGSPYLIILWFFGPKIRQKSSFCAHEE